MAVVGEDEPASETPRAARVRAVLRIEEPIIRAERPVKPQCMIEAGDLEAGIEDGMAMRAERDVEQSHVRKISEYGAMNGGIARERPRRAQPDILFEGACFVLDITAKIDGTDFDGAVLGKPAANKSGIEAPKRRRISDSLGRSSGNGTLGIVTACSSPGSSIWNDAEREKIARPCWIALQRRVVKLFPSRIRSTS